MSLQEGLLPSDKVPAKVEEGVGVHVEEDGEQLLVGETVESGQVLLGRGSADVDLESGCHEVKIRLSEEKNNQVVRGKEFRKTLPVPSH